MELRKAFVFTYLAGALALPGAGRLDSQISTATVEVEVNSAESGPLAGVTAILENVETGFVRQAITGEQGTAALSTLPPGTYRFRCEHRGFSPLQQDGIVLHLGQTARLQVVLSPAVKETITVSTTVPPVDLYKTDSSSNVLPEQISSLPVPDREVQRLAFIAPGVARERGPFRSMAGGPVVGAGSNASRSTVLVDGLDLTHNSLGLSRIGFSQDAVAELRVLNRRYDADIGGTAGGGLSILTRSGTNQLAGSAYGFYRADSLREKGALEQEENDFSRGHYGLTSGGPIREDRAHFFLAAERIEEEDVALFRPAGAFASRAADFDQPLDRTLGFLKLNQAFAEDVSFASSLMAERHRQKNLGVGGAADESYGARLHLDNWNLALEHVAVLSRGRLNELRAQAGRSQRHQPANSTAATEWFSNGNTLQTGGSFAGHQLTGNRVYELRETWHTAFASGGGTHDVRLGGSFRRDELRSRIDLFQFGLFIYLTDTREIPLVYLYGEGSGDVTYETDRYAVFLQDDWRLRPNLRVELGLRYDLDDGGNNPGFTHPRVPRPRKRDTNDVQPRFAFSWDPAGDGRNVLRGGAGLFHDRYQGVAAVELQQNGVTGRVQRTRVNGALIGLNRPPFVLDPSRPTSTGILLAPSIGLIDQTLETPESFQASLGWTRSLSPHLFFEVEGLYTRGRKEISLRDVNFGGNSNPVRLDPAYNQISVFGNQGRSEYKALVLQLNGALAGDGLVTASLAVGERKNISDDNPEPIAFPSDPADLDAEYGRGRADERFRFVLTGVFRLPWRLTLAPVYEYGSGQPWNHRLGYDFNGDSLNSDRPAGVRRNDRDGPPFRQLSLRLTKAFQVRDGQRLEVLVEGFNVFDTTNYDVTSIDNAEFLSGPTLQSPGLPYRRNPNFGQPRATFPGREVQLGLRWSF